MYFFSKQNLKHKSFSVNKNYLKKICKKKAIVIIFDWSLLLFDNDF